MRTKYRKKRFLPYGLQHHVYKTNTPLRDVVYYYFFFYDLYDETNRQKDYTWETPGGHYRARSRRTVQRIMRARGTSIGCACVSSSKKKKKRQTKTLTRNSVFENTPRPTRGRHAFIVRGLLRGAIQHACQTKKK